MCHRQQAQVKYIATVLPSVGVVVDIRSSTSGMVAVLSECWHYPVKLF